MEFTCLERMTANGNALEVRVPGCYEFQFSALATASAGDINDVFLDIYDQSGSRLTAALDGNWVTGNVLLARGSRLRFALRLPENGPTCVDIEALSVMVRIRRVGDSCV